MRMFAFTMTVLFLVTSVFWVTNLDIRIASYFYHPEWDNPWRVGDDHLWQFFYHFIPVLSATILLGTLLIIAVTSTFKCGLSLRLPAIYILCCFLLGPGLVVNTLFKDNWGRERPKNIVELGGSEAYTPPLKYNSNGDGRSFPSGHSSIGFCLISFYFLWKRRNQMLANVALFSTAFIGVGTGVARMAAGGHFFSDVLWSAIITFSISYSLYLVMKQGLEHSSDRLRPSFPSEKKPFPKPRQALEPLK